MGSERFIGEGMEASSMQWKGPVYSSTRRQQRLSVKTRVDARSPYVSIRAESSSIFICMIRYKAAAKSRVLWNRCLTLGDQDDSYNVREWL